MTTLTKVQNIGVQQIPDLRYQKSFFSPLHFLTVLFLLSFLSACGSSNNKSGSNSNAPGGNHSVSSGSQDGTPSLDSESIFNTFGSQDGDTTDTSVNRISIRGSSIRGANSYSVDFACDADNTGTFSPLNTSNVSVDAITGTSDSILSFVAAGGAGSCTLELFGDAVSMVKTSVYLIGLASNSSPTTTELFATFSVTLLDGSQISWSQNIIAAPFLQDPNLPVPQDPLPESLDALGASECQLVANRVTNTYHLAQSVDVQAFGVNGSNVGKAFSCQTLADRDNNP